MTEVVILAIALSMDAFAVSIGLGAKNNSPNLTLKAGLYFGTFQALMPLVGYLAGKSMLGWIAAYANLTAFGLLALIGAKMIYEGIQAGNEDDISQITHKMMLMLAVATSMDAMAAGFSLTLLDVNPYAACVIIGVTTFSFGAVGVYIGRKSGTWLGSKSEIFGGTVLILLGIKILIL
jgi:putative Mn2+ efflux pump MntP